MRKTHVRILLIFVFLFILAPLFQNCSQISDSKVTFASSDQPKGDSGNGRPYEGKPDPGEYYRIVPGYLCQGAPSLAGKIAVTKNDVRMITINPDCSQTSAQLNFSDIEVSPLNRTAIGFRDGIFQRSSQPPAPTAPAPETWCRSIATGAKAFEVLLDSQLSGSFKTATGFVQALNAARSQSGNLVRYQSADLNLEVDLSVQAGEPGEVLGHLSSNTASGDVACRTTVDRPPAPTGGYFVLSAVTTPGNFGSLAAADQLCLQDLLSNEWKGKVNVKLDAAHVFAFICDAGSCQNLDALRSYTFARSGDASLGGRVFMTNADGAGPGSLFPWSGADVFGGTYLPWTNRSGDMAQSDFWSNSPSGTDCNGWTSQSPSVTGVVGITSASNAARWNNGGNQCNESHPLYCVVRGN